MTDPVPVRDEELDEIEQRAHAASPAPWEAFIEARDHTAGEDFIRIGGGSMTPSPTCTSSTTSERAPFESPPPTLTSSPTPARTYPALWPR
jgi:hypothetical protein